MENMEQLKLTVHAVVAVLLVVYYIRRFTIDKYVYQLILAVWIPTTLVPYFTQDRTIMVILGVTQIFMFISVVYFMFRRSGDHAQRTLEILQEMNGSSKSTTTKPKVDSSSSTDNKE